MTTPKKPPEKRVVISLSWRVRAFVVPLDAGLEIMRALAEAEFLDNKSIDGEYKDYIAQLGKDDIVLRHMGSAEYAALKMNGGKVDVE